MSFRESIGAVALLACVTACGVTEDSPPIDKPLGGKADSNERMCELIGEPPDCDICDLQGWLGDGECDVFCDSPDPDCAASGDELRVFVSSVEYTGDLVSHALSATTGLEAGDELCTTLATVAELDGNWRAFLSTDTINAAERVEGQGPWVAMDGVVAFPNPLSFRVRPSTVISHDETGGPVEWYVFTGSQTGGTSSGKTCDGWTSVFGSTSVWEPQWPHQFPQTFDSRPCAEPNQLLCVEIP